MTCQDCMWWCPYNRSSDLALTGECCLPKNDLYVTYWRDPTAVIVRFDWHCKGFEKRVETKLNETSAAGG